MNYIISTSLITLINTVDFHLLLTRKRSVKYCTITYIINYFIMLFGTYLCDIFLKETIFYNYNCFILCNNF